MSKDYTKIFELLERDFWKAFGDSGERILKAIQVLTAKDIISSGGLPNAENLTSRKGNLVRDLQSDQNKSTLRSFGNIVARKDVVAPNAYLLTDVVHEITPKQKALFRYFSIKFKDNREWNKYWWRMGNNPNVRFLYGRKHIERALENVKIEPILRDEIKKAFPSMKRTIVI